MDDKQRRRIQLECLYEMFRDRIEENVIYIVYTENDGKIETTIDQLMSIASCSFTGHNFEPERAFQNCATNSHQTNHNMTTRCRSKAAQELENGKRHLASINGQTGACIATSADAKSRDVGAKKSSEESKGTEVDDDKLDIDKRIEMIQKSIESYLQEKGTCHEKASHYHSRKMFPVTSFYSELASQCRQKVDMQTRELVDLLLLKSENATSIDLHGLNPIQASLVVSELLNKRLDKLSIDKQGEASIDIITGWGKHTVANGHHRIKPTIVALLRDKGFEYYQLNKGALRVKIRR